MEAPGSTGRDRLMLMHDRPPTADFAKANGQAKIEVNFIPVRLRSTTAHKGSAKRHIITRSNVWLADVKDPRVLKPSKEYIPRLFVSFNSLRLSRRRDAESVVTLRSLTTV